MSPRKRRWKNWNAVVGLTGGLGSGKSTVLAMLLKKGATVLDADRIVHELLDGNKATRLKIKRIFGKDIFLTNGKLDKRKLAGVVFGSARKRKALESIIHPEVRRTIDATLQKKRGRIAVCDIPLLYEKGWQRTFDKVIVVASASKVRERRLQRRGYTTADIRARMKAQWPLARKVLKADFVVNNNGTLKKTQNQVNLIWKRLSS